MTPAEMRERDGRMRASPATLDEIIGLLGVDGATHDRWHALAGHVAPDLVADQRLHAPATRDTCTAVTLYSGQLVAQSELSVVITLAPDSGKWKVV